jgi:hypothetical protein
VAVPAGLVRSSATLWLSTAPERRGGLGAGAVLLPHEGAILGG